MRHDVLTRERHLATPTTFLKTLIFLIRRSVIVLSTAIVRLSFR